MRLSTQTRMTVFANYFANKWNQVMFTHAKEVNVTDDDHFLVVFSENRVPNNFCKIESLVYA